MLLIFLANLRRCRISPIVADFGNVWDPKIFFFKIFFPTFFLKTSRKKIHIIFCHQNMFSSIIAITIPIFHFFALPTAPAVTALYHHTSLGAKKNRHFWTPFFFVVSENPQTRARIGENHLDSAFLML